MCHHGSIRAWVYVGKPSDISVDGTIGAECTGPGRFLDGNGGASAQLVCFGAFDGEREMVLVPDNVVNSGLMRWVETTEGRDCVLAHPQESVECQAEGIRKHSLILGAE